MTSPKAALLTALSRTDSPRRDTLRRQRARGFGQQSGEQSRSPLVLASGSPRRLTLLGQIGIEPDALRPASIDETPKRGEMPRALANRLARAKAEAARDQIADDVDLAHAYVLAADTVVAVGRRVLGKPAVLEEAVASLELLSGRAHRVLTSICLITPDDRMRGRVVETRVRFRRLSREDVEAYIASREWRGKAGGYAIQGIAGCFVQKLIGSYTNVVGLPLTEVAGLLVGEGLPVHYGWLDAAEVEPE
jgi:septum formation protein